MPHWRRIPERVPLARVLWSGTTVRNVLSGVCFRKETWLPLCRTTSNPCLSRNLISFLPDTWGSLSIIGNHDRSYHRFRFLLRNIGFSETIDIKLNCLFDVALGRFDRAALRHYIDFKTTGHNPVLFSCVNNVEFILHATAFHIQLYVYERPCQQKTAPNFIEAV